MSKPDLSKHIIKVQGGKEYLTAAGRVLWFRAEHPDWGIDTIAVEVDNTRGYAFFRAEIRNPSGLLVSSAHKSQTQKQFADFIGKAETGAISRALSFAGFGTDDVDDDEEASTRPVDSPQPQRQPIRQPQREQSPVEAFSARQSAVQPAQAAKAYQDNSKEPGYIPPSSPSELRADLHAAYQKIEEPYRAEWQRYIEQTYGAKTLDDLPDDYLVGVLGEVNEALKALIPRAAPSEEASPFGSTLPDDVTPTKKGDQKPVMRK